MEDFRDEELGLNGDPGVVHDCESESGKGSYFVPGWILNQALCGFRQGFPEYLIGIK